MKIKILPLIVIGFMVLNGCDLDREVNTNLTEQQVNETFSYSENRLYAIYGTLEYGFYPIGNAMRSSATDDAEFTNEAAGIQKFNTGNWNEISNPDNVWDRYYTGIFKANMFLENTDEINLDVDRLDPSPSAQEVYRTNLIEIEHWKSEARFLRAYFYFELIKRYGGVPLVTEALEVDDNYQDVNRATLDECIQFILDECNFVANNLPAHNEYASGELGRITSGMALALKSRLLLYAASDLFNDPSWASGFSQPQLIASQNGGRMEKWEAAANAAKTVIELPDYSMDPDYENIFEDFTSSEIIFSRREQNKNDFERINYPVGYDLGNSGNTPSQNLVDAYEMIDGTEFDWDNEEHASAPYENRDPRLNLTVLTNNTEFKGRPVEAWVGGLDGLGGVNATKTGYYLRKYVHPNLDLLQDQTSVHAFVIFRLGEIYLNYAEALNEYDPGHSDIKYYVDEVRLRVGMPELPEGLSQEEMRERIRNERRIELAFEDHRFWDVKRWLKAPETLGSTIEGVRIERVNDSVFNHTKFNVENRVWQPQMYLYPIPQSEIMQMNEWVQNPNW